VVKEKAEVANLGTKGDEIQQYTLGSRGARKQVAPGGNGATKGREKNAWGGECF